MQAGCPHARGTRNRKEAKDSSFLGTSGKGDFPPSVQVPGTAPGGRGELFHPMGPPMQGGGEKAIASQVLDFHGHRLMRETSRFALFRALFFTVYALIGIMFPFFVLHLKNDIGLSGREISYVTGIGGVTVILFQQLWGYIGDVVISKKRLVLLTILGSGLLFLWMGQMRSFWPLLGVAFLFHITFSAINQLMHGFLFMHQGGEARFGPIRAYASLGFIAANVGVGQVSDSFTAGDLDFIFPVFLGVCVFSALLLALIPEVAAPPVERPSFFQVQMHFVSRPGVRLFLLMVFFYQGAHTLSYTMQSVLLAEMGAENTVVAFCYSAAAILELPIFFAATRLRHRFGDTRLLLFAAAVQTVRWLLVWQAQTPGEVIAISMSHAVTFGLFYAAAVGYINGHAGPHYKASAQTMLAFVLYGLAAVFGNFVGGQVLQGGSLQPWMHTVVVDLLGLPDYGPLRSLYVFCAALAAVSFATGICLHLHEKRAGARTMRAQQSS